MVQTRSGSAKQDDAHEQLMAEWRARHALNDELRRTDPAALAAWYLANTPDNTCCFCRETFRGYGHHPSPVLETGVACDECNRTIVIAQRFRVADRTE